MNKELNNTIYQVLEGLLSTQFQANASFNLKYKAYSSNRVGFFSLHKEQLTCKSSLADYIEPKTTSGGSQYRLSMSQNSFIKSFNKCMLCSLSNLRPHVIFNKAVKFNQDIELTPLR